MGFVVKQLICVTSLLNIGQKAIHYCSCNHDRNFSKETDSTTIGIELCKIPQISEH